jgi:hypothetical protein
MPAGRPLKNGVDYFPLDVICDDKFELIEAEHGIQGFGVLIKLYQKIYANNYWIKWDKKSILVFSNRINVDINSINAIINSCVEWDIFNKKLFKKYEILTSTGIQKRFFEIVKRRKVVEVCHDFLLIKIDINAYNNLINVDHNSQRKGKERKGKETLYVELETFLIKTIPPELKTSQESILSFYKHRMKNKIKNKHQPYETTKGINGLFRDLKNCLTVGYDINDCCDVAIENSWLTPRVSYFENIKMEPVNGKVTTLTKEEIEKESKEEVRRAML